MARRLPPHDPEDQALWDALKREITPLHPGETPVVMVASAKVSKSPIPPKNKSRRPTSADAGLVWQAPGQFANFLSGSQKLTSSPRNPNDLRGGGSQGLDRAKAKRLRRGKMSIEGTLDLHGLTQDQAKTRLEQFILSASKAGKRNLLVITGKGLSSGGQGVLKARVPEWLGQGGIGRRVLAFSYAQKRDGEHGALYVLLRRPHG